MGEALCHSDCCHPCEPTWSSHSCMIHSQSCWLVNAALWMSSSSVAPTPCSACHSDLHDHAGPAAAGASSVRTACIGTITRSFAWPQRFVLRRAMNHPSEPVQSCCSPRVALSVAGLVVRKKEACALLIHLLHTNSEQSGDW